MAILIDYEKCCVKNGQCENCETGSACAPCVSVCPVGAITKEDKIMIDHDRCIMCGACVATCKPEALSFE